MLLPVHEPRLQTVGRRVQFIKQDCLTPLVMYISAVCDVCLPSFRNVIFIWSQLNYFYGVTSLQLLWCFLSRPNELGSVRRMKSYC